MSTEALSWLSRIPPLKPGPRAVLTELAKRHRAPGPVKITQVQLAIEAGVSRSRLNDHLDLLEALGLIVREPGLHGRRLKGRVTTYLLPLEKFPKITAPAQLELVRPGGPPSSALDHRAAQSAADVSCPKTGQNNVRKQDTSYIPEDKRNGRGPEQGRRKPWSVSKGPPVFGEGGGIKKLTFFAGKIAEGVFVSQSALTDAEVREIRDRGLCSEEALRKAGFR